jgi:hypothetical protein
VTCRSVYRRETVATGSASHRIFAHVRIARMVNHIDVISKHPLQARRGPEQRCTPQWRSGFPSRRYGVRVEPYARWRPGDNGSGQKV